MDYKRKIEHLLEETIYSTEISEIQGAEDLVSKLSKAKRRNKSIGFAFFASLFAQLKSVEQFVMPLETDNDGHKNITKMLFYGAYKEFSVGEVIKQQIASFVENFENEHGMVFKILWNEQKLQYFLQAIKDLRENNIARFSSYSCLYRCNQQDARQKFAESNKLPKSTLSEALNKFYDLVIETIELEDIEDCDIFEALEKNRSDGTKIKPNIKAKIFDDFSNWIIVWNKDITKHF